MKNPLYTLIVLFLAFSFSAAGNEETCRHRRPWQLGRTQASVTQIYTKDPAGELERKTEYLDKRLVARLSEADGRQIKFPMYCVVRFNGPGRFRLQITCRADGNNQILAFSPRSRLFRRMEFRGVKRARTLTLEFDSSDSRYLVLNCTRGSLFVDALTIERTKGKMSGAHPSTTRPGSKSE